MTGRSWRPRCPVGCRDLRLAVGSYWGFDRDANRGRPVLPRLCAEPIVLRSSWHMIRKGNENVGSLTNCMWSYRLQRNIGYALISTACNPGDAVEVMTEGRPLAGALTGLPFL